MKKLVLATLLVIYLVASLVASAIFGFQVWWQDHAIREFIATPAVITASSLGEHRGKSTSYSPDISYAYFWRGQTYRSNQVQTFNQDGTFQWASDLLNCYRVGTATTVYVDPIHPESAILVRAYLTQPYWICVLVAEGVAFSALFVLGAFGNTPAGAPRRAEMPDGGTLYLPRRTLQEARRIAILKWVLICGLPLGFVAHAATVFTMADFEYAMMMIAWVGAMVWFGIAASYRLLLAYAYSDVRLILHPAYLRLGNTVRLNLEMDAKQAMKVRRIGIVLVCTRYKQSGKSTTRKVIRKVPMMVAGASLSASLARGEMVAADAEVLLDPAWEGTTTTFLNPFHAWDIRVTIGGGIFPAYRAVFPIMIDKAI